MSKDDMHVVMYKILMYFYECLKNGVQVDINKAFSLTGVNMEYFIVVIGDLKEHGYLRGNYVIDMNHEIIESLDLNITSDGVEYLKNNSMMGKVKKTLGSSYDGVIAAAVAATQLM